MRNKTAGPDNDLARAVCQKLKQKFQADVEDLFEKLGKTVPCNDNSSDWTLIFRVNSQPPLVDEVLKVPFVSWKYLWKSTGMPERCGRME